MAAPEAAVPRGSMAEAEAARAAARHPATFVAVAGGFLILGSAVLWLAPMALMPFQCRNSDMCRMLYISERVGYAACVIFSGYAAGYKACQLNFSPVYVQRALTLSHPRSSLIHRALAPFYAMGLIFASPCWLSTLWTATVLISLVVVLVRHLQYPQCSIFGAGIVTGLAWAAMSIVVLYVRAVAGLGAPGVDPQLPVGADRAELAPGDEELGGAEDKPSIRTCAVNRRLRRMLKVLVLSLLALLLVQLLPGINSCLRSEACTSCLQSEACTSCVSPNAAQFLRRHAIAPWSGCNASAASAASAVATHDVAAVGFSDEDLLREVCAHFCPLCPHAPSNASLMEPYEVVDNDGDVVTCLPTRTREGQLCFCDDD